MSAAVPISIFAETEVGLDGSFDFFDDPCVQFFHDIANKWSNAFGAGLKYENCLKPLLSMAGLHRRHFNQRESDKVVWLK